MKKLLLLDYRHVRGCELMLTLHIFNLSLFSKPREQGQNPHPQEVEGAELAIMEQKLNVIRQTVNMHEHNQYYCQVKDENKLVLTIPHK